MYFARQSQGLLAPRHFCGAFRLGIVEASDHMQLRVGPGAGEGPADGKQSYCSDNNSALHAFFPQLSANSRGARPGMPPFTRQSLLGDVTSLRQ
jgi:hypothetical protein